MTVFLTSTGSYLPGKPVENHQIEEYLGTVEGEQQIRRQVLAMNGIQTRHYALDSNQAETHDVYELATHAVAACLTDVQPRFPISYLSSGTTYAPLSGPGLSSILHSQLANLNLIDSTLEINSNSGICAASATALVNTCRAIKLGEHRSALCVGSEQSTQALKSAAFSQVCSPPAGETNLRRSSWFSAVFLRFMLSDGAGACLVESTPAQDRLSFAFNWSYSRSFANEAPLCMKYDTRTALLSQDVDILNRYLFACARKFVPEALERNEEILDDYHLVLPHMSSFFFRRKMERLMRDVSHSDKETVPYWTNLRTAGNTGAASIFIMLDECARSRNLSDGDRLLLFIPESGQFNFVMISLTAVRG